jgi:hypothetical protein
LLSIFVLDVEYGTIYTPDLAVKFIAPVVAAFSSNMNDILGMVKWVKTGVYTSKNTEKQNSLFNDLPTIEEGITRFCKDHGLLN